MQSNDTQINFNELRENTVESLIGRFKEFQSYFKVEDPDYHYRLKEFLFYNTRDEFIGLELLEDRHLLGISERFDEAGINYPLFEFDSIKYGYKRTKRMWAVIESMNINDLQRTFAKDLYRFALDLSLDVTVENAISFQDDAIQIRFHNETSDEADDHTIIIKDGLGFRLCNNKKSIRRLVNYISAVLDLGESWSDELVRLAKIIVQNEVVQNYGWEYVNSITLGSGRIVVEFA